MVAAKYQAMQAQFETWIAAIPDVQPDLTYKDMFGGVLIYTQGKPFALFWGDWYGLKLPEAAQAELRHEAARDADYDPETPGGRQYIKLPPSITGDDDKAAYWIEDSLRYVQASLPAKKRKKSTGTRR